MGPVSFRIQITDESALEVQPEIPCRKDFSANPEAAVPPGSVPFVGLLQDTVHSQLHIKKPLIGGVTESSEMIVEIA